MVIALIVTPDGFPLGYEVLPGNTADCTTLRDMLRKVEAQYGRANRIWVMDRGIPSEEVLAEMRAADPPVSSIWLAPPRVRLSKLEKHLVTLPWQAAREGRRPTSRSCRRNRSLTCWRKATRASTRNAPCEGASSNGYGRASSNSPPWSLIARNCS